MNDSSMNHVHTHSDGTTHSHETDTVHSHGHVHTNTKVVKNRLARVIGHLHAVERMVNDERDCAEILVQLAEQTALLEHDALERHKWDDVADLGFHNCLTPPRAG